MAEMNEDVAVSRAAISRRRALAMGGTISLGGLLAACGVGSSPSTPDGPISPSATTPPSPSATLAAGATATGATPAAVLALLDDSSTCAMTPESTAGPFWFDVDSIRSDIREDRPGTTLELAIRVNDVSECRTDADTGTPIPNSVVEIWHCDAGGVYSGFESASPSSQGGGPPAVRPAGAASGVSDGSYSAGVPEATPTDDGTYLRGAQVTNADGVAQFTTIYPGWYPGRTVHIHLKVHIDRKNVMSGQLYFDESLNDTVNATTPYDEHSGRRTLNADDRLFEEAAIVTTVPQGDGYLGAINLGVVPARS